MGYVDIMIVDNNLKLASKFGGAEGIRTPYLLNAIESLSQLSYSPIWCNITNLAELAVLEQV
jgi:hypothetical protein